MFIKNKAKGGEHANDLVGLFLPDNVQAGLVRVFLRHDVIIFSQRLHSALLPADRCTLLQCIILKVIRCIYTIDQKMKMLDLPGHNPLTQKLITEKFWDFLAFIFSVLSLKS